MRFGVISDTHDRLPVLDRALTVLKGRNIDALIHPGDIIAPFAAKRLLSCEPSVHIIYGNNDGERKGLKAILPQITKKGLSGSRRLTASSSWFTTSSIGATRRTSASLISS